MPRVVGAGVDRGVKYNERPAANIVREDGKKTARLFSKQAFYQFRVCGYLPLRDSLFLRPGIHP